VLKLRRSPWIQIASSSDGPEISKMADEIASTIFVRTGPSCLVLVWHFAGPACCHKAVTLARDFGQVGSFALGRHGDTGSSGGRTILDRPEVQPWQEWWPQLAQCSLMAQMCTPVGETMLCLDHAWGAISSRPECVNTPTPQGKPLIAAVRQGCRPIAELLRHSGATLGPRIPDEMLHDAAARGGEATIALLLLDGRGLPRSEPWAGVNSRPKRHGGTPLDVAMSRGHTCCGELLRVAGGRLSLHVAASAGRSADVEAWLGDGADVEERDSSGATPLWLAVRGLRGDRTLRSSLEHSPVSGEDGADSPRSRCISILLGAKATVDSLPITLETPLLIAASRGNVRHCELLVAAHADPTVQDREGRTALRCAKGLAVQQLLNGAQAVTVQSYTQSSEYAETPLAGHDAWHLPANGFGYPVPVQSVASHFDAYVALSASAMPSGWVPMMQHAGQGPFAQGSLPFNGGSTWGSDAQPRALLHPRNRHMR